MSRRFRPVVLCYHAVSDEWEHPLAVPPRSVARHVRGLLQRRFRASTIEDVVAGRTRTVHVSFDDAFKSVQRVIPLLEQLGVRSTVFACAALAEAGGPFPLDDADDVPAVCRAELTTMTWDELAELAERGVTIGSHTASHAHLPALSDEEVTRELRESRARIEARLGKPCRYLAYPYGEHDARVRAAARRAGYAAAFALPGRMSPVDLFALPRIGVWRSETPFQVALKTSFLRPTSAMAEVVLRRAYTRRAASRPHRAGRQQEWLTR